MFEIYYINWANLKHPTEHSATVTGVAVMGFVRDGITKEAHWARAPPLLGLARVKAYMGPPRFLAKMGPNT